MAANHMVGVAPPANPSTMASRYTVALALWLGLACLYHGTPYMVSHGIR